MTKLNGSSRRINGWTHITIYGTPTERGYAYGTLCAKEFVNIQRMLNFFIYETYGVPWPGIIRRVMKDFKESMTREFPEFIDEIRGIAKGIQESGVDTSFDEIFAWNLYCSIPSWFTTISGTTSRKEGGARDRCSAFMAVGDWTKTGEIVCAHNSFTDFIDGQYSNVVLTVIPAKGNSFIMQTSPAWIWSGTDFFITSAGFIGTETTIGGFVPFKINTPIAFRIRQAMQYATTLDEYVSMLLNNNSGDYANAWLIGDIRRGEIMRFELGLEYHDVQKTTNGVFIGFNAPYNPQIRNLEVINSGFYDIRRHQGARRVRLQQLMDKYKGELTTEIAKEIIGDHHDVYLKKENPCSRTICSHYELDAREYMSQESRPPPFSPRGAVDGIVCSSTMAKEMTFEAKFGSSCNIGFNAAQFFQEHIQYDNFSSYVFDRPVQPWTLFGRSNKRKISTNRRTRRRLRG